MRLLARQVSPLLFADSGPTCLADECPEGNLTCGEPYTQEEIGLMDLSPSVFDPSIP